MSKHQDDYRDYLFTSPSEGERLTIQHEHFKPSVLAAFNRLLDQYGLAERLTQAKATKTKLRLLNFGCGEGLYLHDLAQVLEARGLLEGAELNGLDINPASVAT